MKSLPPIGGRTALRLDNGGLKDVMRHGPYGAGQVRDFLCDSLLDSGGAQEP